MVRRRETSLDSGEIVDRQGYAISTVGGSTKGGDVDGGNHDLSLLREEDGKRGESETECWEVGDKTEWILGWYW